jgi:hypothetical protein
VSDSIERPRTAPRRRCRFCRGVPAAREIAGSPVCGLCWSTYWRIGETMVAGAELSCDGCGAEAVEVVDGHPLCRACYEPVAGLVARAMAGATMAGTLAAIRQLPTIEGRDG